MGVIFASIISEEAYAQIAMVQGCVNLGKIHTVQDVEHWATES